MRFGKLSVPWCGKLAAHQKPGEPSAPPTRRLAGQFWLWLRKQMNEFVGEPARESGSHLPLGGAGLLDLSPMG